MPEKKPPLRRRRSDAFFGLHFDFHANGDCPDVGKSVTAAMIEKIITQTKPDYVQCDCKGGAGYSSYATKVGHQDSYLVRDQLRVWRQVTAKHGVPLIMHYSGLWDKRCAKLHPSWCQVDENGKRNEGAMSVFGPYVDKLMIPQLKELRDEYGVDGMWVDGDCWEVYRDYSKAALKAFREETGIKSVPRKTTDRHFNEFTEFCRERFRWYLNHYIDALHAHDPGIELCSNWAYGSFMPEPVEAAIDFMSGDFAMVNSINVGRIEGRFMVHQGVPWDLMGWGFGGDMIKETEFSTKTVPQMAQMAGVVMALGGGFQVYLRQKPDASISVWQLDVAGRVGDFCRARQPFCHEAQPVPQIALLHPGKDVYKRYDERLFFPGTVVTEEKILERMQGVLQCLLDAQNVVDITMAHHLKGHIGEYPLVVIPEWDYLGRTLKKQLLDYVEAGGNLLVVGPEAAALFKKQLGVKFFGKPEVRDRWISHNRFLACLKTQSQDVRLLKGAKKFGDLYAEDDDIGPTTPAASITRCGKGKIAAVYVRMGERYCNGATAVARDFLNSLVHELFPEPLVEVTGSPHVDVTAARKDGKLMINLLNTAGPHADSNVYVFDHIPPVGPIEVTLRIAKRPKRITSQPAGVELKYTFRKGEVTLTVPRLEIHDILVVES